MSETDRNNGIPKRRRNVRRSCVAGHSGMIVKYHSRPEAAILSSTEGGSSRAVIEQMREIWVMADSDTITDDLRKARELAALVPESARKEAEEFVRAMERLGDWLRSG